MAAYRVPHRPEVEAHARRQTQIARWVGLALIWLLVGVLIFLGERAIPDQHLPWTPLSVVDPIGAATKAKAARTGEDVAACRGVLAKGGLTYVLAEDSANGFCSVRDAIQITGGMAPLLPADAAMTCKQALAVAIWERQIVQPAAFEAFGHAVVGIEHYGAYSCRRIYGQQAGPPSEHASANALDVAGFRLANGEVVWVRSDWDDPGPRGRFLRQVREGACRVFITTLSPDYNAAHADHLHLDMGGKPLCA